MSTETLTPTPIDSEADRSHFIHSVIDSQSEEDETPRAERVKRPRKETVESIDPENVHLYGSAVLADVIEARRLHSSEAFQKLSKDEQDEIIANQLDEIQADDDPEQYGYYKNRIKLGSMLTAPEEKFDKIARRYSVYQARRDGVKLARTPVENDAAPLRERMKKLFSSENEQSEETESEESVLSRRKLRRDLKRTDRQFDGLVGEIAKTGTKSAYLEQSLERYSDTMNAQKYEINDRNRRSAERETIRKMVQPLVEAKNLEGEARKEYEDELVDSFHQYTKLSDDERDDFHETLESRYEVAKELSALESADEAEKREKTPILGRTKRALGATAAALVSRSKDRWNARKSDEGEQLDEEYEEQEEQAPKHRQNRSARIRNALGTLSPSDALARYRTNKVMREHDLANMSDEERAEVREKSNTRKAAIALGVVGVAAVGVGLYLQKYGFDNPFNGIGDGSRGSGDLPGDRDLPPNGEGPVDPPVDQGGGGSESLSRNELFDGSRGDRSLTSANTERLSDFLDNYKVKANDDQGVWGISEKYLQSQGVKNPTVFETDAVKDYILQHSSLTNSSIIHPGDTIKLK